MKKIILAAVVMVILLSTGKSFGQTANLSITLQSFISFTVNDPDAVVFDTETKYTNGITNLKADNITVVSSGGYIVKAIAGTINGDSNLEAGTVLITAADGSEGNFDGVDYESDVALPALSTATPATILSSTESSWSGTTAATKFNVTYKIGTNAAYAGKFTGSTPVPNTIPVVYTVTAQ